MITISKVFINGYIAMPMAVGVVLSAPSPDLRGFVLKMDIKDCIIDDHISLLCGNDDEKKRFIFEKEEDESVCRGFSMTQMIRIYGLPDPADPDVRERARRLSGPGDLVKIEGKGLSESWGVMTPNDPGWVYSLTYDVLTDHRKFSTREVYTTRRYYIPDIRRVHVGDRYGGCKLEHIMNLFTLADELEPGEIATYCAFGAENSSVNYRKGASQITYISKIKDEYAIELLDFYKDIDRLRKACLKGVAARVQGQFDIDILEYPT